MFRGKNTEETEEWANALEETIRESDGYAKDYNYLGKYHRFWRVRQGVFRRTMRVKKNFERMLRLGTFYYFGGRRAVQ